MLGGRFVLQMNKLRYSKVKHLPKFSRQSGASQVVLMVKNPLKMQET